MEKYIVIEDSVDGYYVLTPDEYHGDWKNVVCECQSQENAKRIAKALAKLDTDEAYY
jgi:hypothetical protein